MIKPITGTWFEFQHHSKIEGTYWNPLLKQMNDDEWRQLIRDMKAEGMEVLVLLATSLDFKAYFDTDIYPKADLNCTDPIGVLLSETEAQGMKVFMSCGYYDDWNYPLNNRQSLEVQKRAFRAMEQICEQYGQYKSLYGWYLPDEAGVNGKMADEFMDYINRYSAQMHKLSKDYKMLVAPYNTRLIRTDDEYVAQLENLDCDFIAYQDEVGVQRCQVEELAGVYEGLKKAHDKAGRSKLWADIEAFSFEGPVYDSPLLAAPEERVKRQVEAVSPFVDRVLIYEYQVRLGKRAEDK